MANPGGGLARDTNADWRKLSVTDPYWGVVTDPSFKGAVLPPDKLQAFYDTGRQEVAGFVAELETLLGAPFRASTALDFGCGVGRLAEAMTGHADKVTGYDIAPGMLELARARGGAVRYVDALPDESFGWINSYIVFQHIPPERGMVLLGELLRRLEPEGVITLHFTIWREEQLKVRPWRAAARRMVDLVKPREGLVSMYEYDLGAILEELNRHGIFRMILKSTDHGGHHGVMIVGRRDLTDSSKTH